MFSYGSTRLADHKMGGSFGIFVFFDFSPHFSLGLLKLNLEKVIEWFGNKGCGACNRCLGFSNYLEILLRDSKPIVI